MKESINLQSTITCPKCGYLKEEIMLTDACQYFNKYENYLSVLKLQQGDYFEYCSYGSVKCPSKQ